MYRTFKKLILSAAVLAIFAQHAQAGIFNDDEARKAIIELRAKVDTLHAQQMAALQTEAQGKADKKSVLDLVGQLESMHQEISQLRGMVEILTHSLEQAESRNKQLYADLDGRIGTLEPQREVINGEETLVSAEEKSLYTRGIAKLKDGEYAGVILAFNELLSRFPSTSYGAQAQHLVGTAYYAQRDYRNAIAAQKKVTLQYPDSSFAAEALLNMASSYMETKSKTEAKYTLTQLLKLYPESNAANIAKERLQLLK